MTFDEMVGKIKNLCDGVELKDYKKHLAVEVAVKGEAKGVFYIEVKDGKVDVQPYAYNDRDIRFTATAENFIKLAGGKLDPVFAFTTGKLKIDGGIDKAFEFKKVIEAIKEQKG